MALILTPLATDNFTPNAGSLNPAHWTTFTDAAYYGAARPHSGAFESTTTAFNNSLTAAAAYTGVPFPANQYVAFTLASWSLGSNDESDWWLRMPDLTGDIGYVADAFDNGDGITGALELGYYDISQQYISLWSNENTIVSQGDTFIFAIVGSTLYLYQNGVLVSGAVNDPLNYYPSTGPVGLDVDPQDSATELGLSNFTAGSAALGPNASSGSTFNAAVRIPGRSDRDYLHLLNSSGQVIGWIDPNGLLGGSLGTTGAALPTVRAQWTIPGTASRDFIHFIDQEGDIVAWIDFTGKYQTTGSPAYRAEKVLTGSPTQDFLQITNSLGAEIGWIDYTGALNGTL